MTPLPPIACAISICLLVWFWATDGAPEPVPPAAYIVPVVLAGLLVGVLVAIHEQRKR